MQGSRHSSSVISERLAVAFFFSLENVPFHHTGLKPVLLSLLTCQLCWLQFPLLQGQQGPCPPLPSPPQVRKAQLAS